MANWRCGTWFVSRSVKVVMLPACGRVSGIASLDALLTFIVDSKKSPYEVSAISLQTKNFSFMWAVAHTRVARYGETGPGCNKKPI
jgi:hypothetical protein